MPWLAIKLFFGGFLKRLSGALSALLGWIGSHPWQAAVIALALASVWLWRGWNGAEADATIQKAGWVAEIKARNLDRLEYEKAQDLAKAAQADADRREFALKTSLAENARVLSVQSDKQARSAVAAYAASHPVRMCRTDGAAVSATSGTGSLGLPGDPGRVPGEETAADWVAITRPNLDALAGEAVQSAVKTEFLIAAEAAGWAVRQSKAVLPEPAF